MGEHLLELIRLSGVHFAYPGRPRVLAGVDFTLNSGDRLGIVGPNGAGKSTLFKLAMGLVKPTRGEVFGLGEPCLVEKDFRPLRRAVGYLFQDPDDQLFCPTVAEDVAFGPLNLGKSRDEVLSIVDHTLEALDLSYLRDRVTYQLSGGEKHLAALAAVLALEPQALLLDEPGNGLDQKHAVHLERVLLESDLSWAVVSHDQGFLERICRRMLRVEDGMLREI
jgi:cobalt/nickel transport system ATP-binding protein